MKSAYELAMERLEKEKPAHKLAPEKLEALRELDSLYQSKIAEREVFLEGKIRGAKASGDGAEVEQFSRQLAHDLSILREELEEKKERIRKS